MTNDNHHDKADINGAGNPPEFGERKMANSNTRTFANNTAWHNHLLTNNNNTRPLV